MRKEKDWRDAVAVFGFLMFIWVLAMVLLFVLLYLDTDGGVP